MLVAAQLLPEALEIQPQLFGDVRDLAGCELVLVGQQAVVHLPELALVSRSLHRFRGDLRARVDVVEGQVPPHVAHVVAKRGQQLANHRLRQAAVRTLEVPVLDERDGGVVGTADVVALRVDFLGQVEDVLRGRVDLAGEQLPRHAPVESEQASRHERRDQRASEHAELCLLQVPPGEGEARDQQCHREADPGDGSSAHK